MSREIIVKPPAQHDIDEAFIWYEKALDNLGFEFLLSLEAVIEAIKRNPEHAGFAYKHIRSIALMRFPFSVYYIVETEVIIVLAVFHHSRNPVEWEQRTE